MDVSCRNCALFPLLGLIGICVCPEYWCIQCIEDNHIVMIELVGRRLYDVWNYVAGSYPIFCWKKGAQPLTKCSLACHAMISFDRARRTASFGGIILCENI